MTHIYPVTMGPVTCYLLQGTKGLILVDSGYPHTAWLLWRALKRLHKSPTDIKLIVVTHGHIDHVGSLKAIVDRSGAKVVMQQEDAKCLAQGKSAPVVFSNPWARRLFDKYGSRVPAFTVDTMFTESCSLEPWGVEGTIHHTPGHTPGSSTVLLDSGEAMVGDTAQCFPLISKGSYFPPIAWDSDKLSLSWQKLLSLGAQTIYPGHGKPRPAANTPGF